jgi:RNA polymerase primary sigma factor
MFTTLRPVQNRTFLSQGGVTVRDRSDLLTQKEEAHLCAVFQGKVPGNPETAWAELESRNSGLISSLARKFISYNYEFEDALQDATLGFWTAVSKFDGTLGHKLSTYATHWIVQGLRRGKDALTGSIHIPAHAQEDLKMVSRKREALHNFLGREPTDDELARDTGLKLDKLRELLNVPRNPVSLDTKVGGQNGSDNDAFLVDFIAARNNEADTIQKALDIKQVVEGFIAVVPNERDRLIIRMRYLREMTFQEVADELGVSKQLICQREKMALRFIRNTFGITFEQHGPPRPRNAEELKHRDAEVVRLHSEGMTPLQIGERFSIGLSRVNDILKCSRRARSNGHRKSHTKVG